MTAPKRITVTHTAKPKSGGRFARIDNDVLQSESLSFRARGLLAYILSRPADWQHSAESLSNASREGLHAIRGALRELVAAGHARLESRRGPDGMVRNGWFFTEAPSAVNQHPVTPSPDTEKPHSAPDADLPRPVKPALGEPAFGQPHSGQPGFGKPAPYETTVGETTVDETKEIETTVTNPPVVAVAPPDEDCPFSLTDCPEPAAISAPVATPAAPAQPANRHHDICQQWGPAFQQAFGAHYAFSGRDASALKRLLASVPDSADTILELAESAWARSRVDRFASGCKRAATLAGLCDHFNAIRVELQSPGPVDKHRAGWVDDRPSVYGGSGTA